MEEDEQVRLLRDLGCDQIQGYYVGRPVPPEEIDALLFAGTDQALRQRLAAA